MSSCLKNLKSLIVQGCSNLKELFSSSIVDSFVQLEHLEICKCARLEEIVAIDESREEEMGDIISFPRLLYLNISGLAKLRRLYSGNYIEFPSLVELRIAQCRELKSFIFDDKVGFPNLQKMKIYWMDNLKMIWHHQLVRDSFCKLMSLEVASCDELLTVFPSNMYRRFLRLESLSVGDCRSIEEIFDLPERNFEERHSIAATTELRELHLNCLENLKHIWNKDTERMFSFGNLQNMTVSLCENFKNLFPASIARSLLELEYLSVSSCTVKEIVSMEGADEAVVKFVFPKLTSLHLHNLPELTTFCCGIHSVEGPVLKMLELLYQCPNVEIFASQFLHSMQPPLFMIEKDFPCLEEFGLSGNDVTMMWRGGVPESLFHKLRSLEANEDMSVVLPLGIIKKFHNLEKLSLISGSYKEIFSHGEFQKHNGTLAKMKILVLEELFDLKYMWKQDSGLDSILNNLEVLKVKWCHSLINLIPPSASFQNLSVLEVWSCNRLIDLVTSSTAKSLVQLVQMSIGCCKMIKKVVANNGDVTEEKIIFSKLKSLSLFDLPNLTSFCSENYTFEFSSLEELTVHACPKMNIFCQGVLRAPALQILKTDRKWIEPCQDVDLNTTLRHFHENVNVQF